MDDDLLYGRVRNHHGGLLDEIRLTSSSISQDIACGIKVLPDNECFNSTEFESTERIIDAEAVLARILANFVKVFLNELLLLHKLDVRERLGGKFNSLDTMSVSRTNNFPLNY